MKNFQADWCVVRSDGDILIFKHPLLWRLYFGLLGFAFAAICLYSLVLFNSVSIEDDDGSRSMLLSLIIIFGVFALPCLLLALPYLLKLDFRRKTYETQHSILGSRHGTFTGIKNVYIQQIRRGSGHWYRVRLSWMGGTLNWVPILTETPELSGAEALASNMAERLEVPFTGLIMR